ncbi:PHYH [Cordylochernes scorpioides]|uniref:PHYH n=1 Tax=Cordylochernes scorpioides TaxID=51811 RepID=A0ABY6LJQ5_9ARAC|nr:PHYH [Cordylochernes scorpioides]
MKMEGGKDKRGFSWQKKGEERFNQSRQSGLRPERRRPDLATAFERSFIHPSNNQSSILSTSTNSKLDLTSGSLNASSNYSLNSSSWLYKSNPSFEFVNESLETPISKILKSKKSSTPIYSLESSPVGKNVLNQSDSILETSAFRSVNYSPQQSHGTQDNLWNLSKTFVDYIPILKRCQYQPATRSPQASINSDGPESPNHQTYNSVLCRLNIKDVQLTNWIGNLRKWISQTILRRLTKEMAEVNEILYRTGSQDLQIGEVSLLNLKQIASTKSQTLPTLSALLPYLEISTNQEYLVERLKQLAAGGSMSEYRWNSGGKFRGKPWGDELPTDAAIIFHIFCCYMDSRLPDCYPVGKTFSLQYVKKFPEKPQLAQDLLYIYQSQNTPPHFQVALGKNLVDIPKGRINLFCAILVFLDHIREHHASMLSRVNLGPSGINILCVLQDAM